LDSLLGFWCCPSTLSSKYTDFDILKYIKKKIQYIKISVFEDTVKGQHQKPGRKSGLNLGKKSIRTCCGNEKLAGSLDPGMTSKGKPAAI